MRRAAFGEIRSLWLLMAQELVQPNITPDLVLGPVLGATGKYQEHNIWLTAARIVTAISVHGIVTSPPSLLLRHASPSRTCREAPVLPPAHPRCGRGCRRER